MFYNFIIKTTQNEILDNFEVDATGIGFITETANMGPGTSETDKNLLLVEMPDKLSNTNLDLIVEHLALITSDFNLEVKLVSDEQEYDLISFTPVKRWSCQGVLNEEVGEAILGFVQGGIFRRELRIY